MIPLPPLDGGRVAVGLLPYPLAVRLARLERYGMFIVLDLRSSCLPWIGQQIGVDLDIVGWILIQPIRYVERFDLLDNGEQRGRADRVRTTSSTASSPRRSAPAPGGEMELHLDLDGFEGPIDVL